MLVSVYWWGALLQTTVGSAEDNKFKFTVDHFYFIVTTQIDIVSHPQVSLIAAENVWSNEWSSLV